MPVGHRERAAHHLGHGFTLVELLVVIAIIAVLASMLLPALSNAKERAKRAACMGNLRQQGLAFCTYADDNDAMYPRADTSNGTRPYAIPWTLAQFFTPYGLAPEAHRDSAWCCPSAVQPPRGYRAAAPPVLPVDLYLIDKYVLLAGLKGNSVYTGSASPTRTPDPVGPIGGDNLSWCYSMVATWGSNHAKSAYVLNDYSRLQTPPYGWNQLYSDARVEWHNTTELAAAPGSGWLLDSVGVRYYWAEP
ncbi:MAG: hypothetical protein A3K19_17455 [Lentisphaerae bacterium RIFOXYB12_FULL_65_16]|nr:MAG: hypothetical protein A3K18_09385 [Lentisphaerae bacterium RIFOXYA12_64_32]OGV85651.1 MAG: hypothetical protein A3K19_17455 [Lentisphaerae bacterium RIFOXYB12_FULL_65_16]